MALNYGIQLNAFDENDGTTRIADVKAHAYFYKVNGSSSSSTWDGAIRLTNGFGQVSFNLGDSSFLTSEGKIDNGDIVLITAWLATNNNTSIDDKSSQTSGEIIGCVNFIHVVDTSSSSWVENFVLPDVKPPTCNISWPTSTLTGHSFTIGNTSTVNEGPFTYNVGNVNRSDLYQNFTKYSQNLFLGRQIKESFYQLQETNSMESGTTDFTYSWVDAGVYNSYVRVYNYLGYYCESTKSYTVKYNQPTIDFDFTFSKLLNSNKHIGVGNDDLMLTENLSHTNFGDTWEQLNATFEWDISDLTQTGEDNSDSYTGKDVTFEPTKYFLSEGTKDIVLKIRWNDGFEEKLEVMTLNPFLDVYNIGIDFHWETSKNYKVGSIWVPLGDDDLVTLYNDDSDIATQNYSSEEQWKRIVWTITKKKNDSSDDTETFTYDSDTHLFTETPEFFVKYYHTSTDLASVRQSIEYWDGYKDVSKTLLKDMSTQKYNIVHDFHWVTDFYGDNKVVTSDDDGVTIINDSYFTPQNNLTIIDEVDYDITKMKYTSYTDLTLIDDSEHIDTVSFSTQPYFNIRYDGTTEVKNTVIFYNGYETETSVKIKEITSVKSNIVADFTWYSRNGQEVPIEGRDDIVRFKSTCTIKNYYNDHQQTSSPRFLMNNWKWWIDYDLDNFSDITVIGGPKFTESGTWVFEESYYPEYEPEKNYFAKRDTQDIELNTEFNNGFYNEDFTKTKQLSTVPYQTLIINAY